MALQVNSISPTVINVNQGSDFTIDFPTGTKTAPLLSKIGPNGSTVYYYNTTFEQTYSTTYSKYLQLQINGVFLTSSMQEVYKTGSSLNYHSYRASFSNGILKLEQYVYLQTPQQGAASSRNLFGTAYTGTFSPNTSLTVLKYATCGSDLKEATRSSVSSYTSTQLNNWVGLENDTWGAITNASSLVFGDYYYIRVYVSDTGKYGKFCVKFKSANGTTITVDNMGWGYDGEVIYSTSVWGKPFSLTKSVGTNSSLTVKRTSSPNQNSSLISLASGEKVYYGDVLSITAKPASGYKLTSFTINGTEYGSGQTSAVTKTVTVSGDVTVVVAATSSMQKLISPDIQYATLSAADLCRVNILNENNVTVTAHLEFYDVNNYVYGSESANISANTADDIWITLNSSGQYDSGWYVEAYFEASGYQDSDTSTLVGR